MTEVGGLGSDLLFWLTAVVVGNAIAGAWGAAVGASVVFGLHLYANRRRLLG